MVKSILSKWEARRLLIIDDNMIKSFFNLHAEARSIHAFKLRSDGLKYSEIAKRLGSVRKNGGSITSERARHLVMKGSRILNHPDYGD